MLTMNGQMMFKEDVKPFAAYQVQVQLNRRKMSARGLARRIDMKPAAMQRRMKGQVAFSVDEIQRIAMVLSVEPAIFFPPVPRRCAR